jgi:hypothetical protein
MIVGIGIGMALLGIGLFIKSYVDGKKNKREMMDKELEILNVYMKSKSEFQLLNSSTIF